MPRLAVIAGPDQGRTLELSDTQILGRDRDATIPLSDQGTSRKHLRISRTSDGWTVIDLESKNGTWVNGERISRVDLKDGDVIVLGETHLRVEGIGLAATLPNAPRRAPLPARQRDEGSALSVDLSQYPAWIRYLVILVVAAAVVAITWFAYKSGEG